MKVRLLKSWVILSILAASFAAGLQEPHEPRPYSLPDLKFFPEAPANNLNPLSKEGVRLGRFLFYDPILSGDSTISCSSCHRQQRAFSDSPNQFSRGINGKSLKRNTMPLFNLAWNSAQFWDGRAASLEEQAFHPLRESNEMNLSWTAAEKRIRRSKFYRKLFNDAYGELIIDSNLIARALAQFTRSLISHNSEYDQVLRGEKFLDSIEYQGFILVNDQTKGDCLHCHTTDADALGTTGKFSNNGLDPVYNISDYNDPGLGGVTGDTNDFGLFRIPSLRNVALTSPYMHDGRFSTLREVLNFYSEGVHRSLNVDTKMGSTRRGGAHLSEAEKECILAFLQTLTDSMFINNPEHANPFERL